MEPDSNPDPARAKAAPARGVALPLLAAVLVMVTVLNVPRPPINLKVDSDISLGEVLNYAHQQGLQFGPELVFTYGPLGYLTFFYFSPHAAGARLVADAVLCLTVAFGLCLVAWRQRLVWGCALLGVFMFVAANMDPRTDLLVDTGFLCWGLLCLVESGRRLILSAVTFAVLAAFCALSKTSFLFMAGPSVVLLAASLVARGKLRLGIGIVVGFCTCVVLGWVAAGQNLAHLGTYLTNALAVVKGYNQALSWEALPQASLSGFVVIGLAVGMVVIRALGWSAGMQENASQPPEPQRIFWRRVLFLAWVSALLFPIWKHAFVYGNAYHVVYFFGFASVLALALEILPCEKRAARLWARGLEVACCLGSVLTLQSLFFAPGWRSLAQPIQACGYHARCLLQPGDFHRRMNAYFEENRRLTRWPAGRALIGNASVDVFGQQQTSALLNDLNYRPRPVFQSYVACSAPLMRLNEQFYLSEAAPDYVLFGLGSIDRRFPPLADAMVLRDLLVNFELAGVASDFLVLKRQSTRPPRLKLLREGAVQPGERIDLSGTGDAKLWLDASDSGSTGRLQSGWRRGGTRDLRAYSPGGERPRRCWPPVSWPARSCCEMRMSWLYTPASPPPDPPAIPSNCCPARNNFGRAPFVSASLKSRRLRANAPAEPPFNSPRRAGQCAARAGIHAGGNGLMSNRCMRPERTPRTSSRFEPMN